MSKRFAALVRFVEVLHAYITSLVLHILSLSFCASRPRLWFESTCDRRKERSRCGTLPTGRSDAEEESMLDRFSRISKMSAFTSFSLSQSQRLRLTHMSRTAYELRLSVTATALAFGLVPMLIPVLPVLGRSRLHQGCWMVSGQDRRATPSPRYEQKRADGADCRMQSQ